MTWKADCASARHDPGAVFPLIDPALQQVWRGERAIIAVSGDPSSAAEPRLASDAATGVVLALWGRIHNRAELLAHLGSAAGESSARLALAAWQRWGRDCATRLVGDFSFALFDPRDGSVFAVRDALGIKPLFHAPSADGIAVATSIPALRNLTGCQFEPDPQWIARYLVHLSMSREATAFSGIGKVPPGHWLAWTGGATQIVRYHRFDDSSPRADRRDPAVLDGYRAVLEEAVRCRLESPDPIGIETSGGIDSSTIAGFAPRMVAQPHPQLHGFGFIGSEKEPDAILGVSRYAGLRNNHLFVRTASGADDEPFNRAIAVLGHPAEHGNSVSHMPFYLLARKLGVHTLLSGFGGDEGVTSYAINHRRDLLESGQTRALWALLKGNSVTRSLRFVKALRSHRRYPEFSPHMLPGARRRLAYHILDPDMADAIDLKAELMNSARWHLAYDSLNRFAIGMVEKPFVSTRTESCSLMAASYGIEYGWPLLDQRLLAQWLAAPTIEKASKDMGRYLHRRAIAGVVPDDVRLQVSKYMGPSLPGQEAQSGMDWHTLLADLHPRLASLVSRQRIDAAIAAQSGAADGDLTLFALRRPLIALREVDSWLRRCDEDTSAMRAHEGALN